MMTLILTVKTKIFYKLLTHFFSTTHNLLHCFLNLCILNSLWKFMNKKLWTCDTKPLWGRMSWASLLHPNTRYLHWYTTDFPLTIRWYFGGTLMFCGICSISMSRCFIMRNLNFLIHKIWFKFEIITCF